jgi:hypothetical protein
VIEPKYFNGEIYLKKEFAETWGLGFTSMKAINALVKYLHEERDWDRIKHGYTLEQAQEIIDGVVQLMIEDDVRLLAASRAQAETWSDSDRESAQRKPTGLVARLRSWLR